MTYVEILQTETIKRTLYPDYRSNTVLVHELYALVRFILSL
jgi:hypothetical protein